MALREACDMLKLEITSAARYKMPRTLLISSERNNYKVSISPLQI
jgi:hypothetical protein